MISCPPTAVKGMDGWLARVRFRSHVLLVQATIRAVTARSAPSSAGKATALFKHLLLLLLRTLAFPSLPSNVTWFKFPYVV